MIKNETLEVIKQMLILLYIFMFQELLDQDRWTDLVNQFRYENFKLHQLNNASVFTVTLQAGLSALKTPYPFCRKFVDVLTLY